MKKCSENISEVGEPKVRQHYNQFMIVGQSISQTTKGRNTRKWGITGKGMGNIKEEMSLLGVVVNIMLNQFECPDLATLSITR